MHIGAEEQGGGSFVGRWFRQPQGLFLRKAFVQIHMWTGLTLALYVVMISLTGSVLVYRNELYRAFSPEPVLVAGSGVALGDEALKEAARRIFPGQEVKELVKGGDSQPRR